MGQQETLPAKATHYLIWGDDPLDFPVPVQTTRDPDEPFSHVIVQSEENISQLYRALVSRRALLTPILNFSGTTLPREDFAAEQLTAETLERGCLQTAPIVDEAQRLAASPQDVVALQVLAIAAFENTAINAAWDSSSESLVCYPQLAGIETPRALLEELSEMGMFERHFFDRLHICPQCRSSRLNIREECPSCRSSQIAEVPLIHHYRCSYQAPEQAFLDDDTLRCPKCTKELRHYGVDYDRPNATMLCEACGTNSQDADVGMLCIDCGAHQDAQLMATIDWFNYELTPQGSKALRDAWLPRTTLQGLLDRQQGMRPVKDFLLLAKFTQRLSARYERPWSACVLELTNVDDLKQTHGAFQVSKTLALVCELIGQEIRSCDSVTSNDDSVYLLLPETPTESVQIVIDRIREQLEKMVAADVELDARTFSLDEAEAFYHELSS